MQEEWEHFPRRLDPRKTQWCVTSPTSFKRIQQCVMKLGTKLFWDHHGKDCRALNYNQTFIGRSLCFHVSRFSRSC
jgi:hypothetical protein